MLYLLGCLVYILHISPTEYARKQFQIPLISLTSRCACGTRNKKWQHCKCYDNNAQSPLYTSHISHWCNT